MRNKAGDGVHDHASVSHTVCAPTVCAFGSNKGMDQDSAEEEKKFESDETIKLKELNEEINECFIEIRVCGKYYNMCVTERLLGEALRILKVGHSLRVLSYF
jgi:hypothetical protein